MISKKTFGQIVQFFPGAMLTSEQIFDMRIQLSKKQLEQKHMTSLFKRNLLSFLYFFTFTWLDLFCILHRE